MKSFVLFTFALLSSFVALAQRSAKQPVPIILDTDIGPDYDDVGAMAILHALADAGEARPLAVISSNKDPLIVPTIDVMNTYFGRPNLPTGAPKGPGADMGATRKWPGMLIEKYPHRIQSTADAPDAVTTYRQILARQPDRSVTIVTIGFMTNLADLLASGPDAHSKLAGPELVRKKVKQLVSMAGDFPKGREFNVFMDSVASQNVFAGWPTPVVLSGFEIGKRIKTGLRVVADNGLRGPVKDVYAWCLPKSTDDRDGRMSWDQTAVLVGIRGVEPYFGLKRGRILVQKNGSNTWQDDPNGPHAHLTEAMPLPQVTEVIETLMMHRPKSE